MGGTLERTGPGEAGDFKFNDGENSGKTVDFMLTPDTIIQAGKINQFFQKNLEDFKVQLVDHVNKVDIVSIDM